MKNEKEGNLPEPKPITPPQPEPIGQEGKNVQTLTDANIINPVLLSDAVKQAIEALSDDQIRTLKEVHEVVPLGAFLLAKAPQR